MSCSRATITFTSASSRRRGSITSSWAEARSCATAISRAMACPRRVSIPAIASWQWRLPETTSTSRRFRTRARPSTPAWCIGRRRRPRSDRPRVCYPLTGWRTLLDAASRFVDERIFLRGAADRQVGAVRLVKSRAAHAFARNALVKVRRRHEREGWLFIEEQRDRFAPALQTAFEFRVGLRPRLRAQIGAAQIEV